VLLFSIHRYLVVLELLAPLLLWQLSHYLFPARFAARAAGSLVATCALVALLGWNGWGHAGWARDAFRVQSPPGTPAGTILLVGTDPQAWRIPFLSSRTAYASVGSNFPESPAYVAEVRRLAGERGPVMAMLPAPLDASGEAVRRKVEVNESRNRWAARLWLDRGDCRIMKWAASRSRSRKLTDSADSPTGRCRFDLLPEQLGILAARGGADAPGPEPMRVAATILQRHGFKLEPESCVVYGSWIGAEPNPYQLCRVAVLQD